MLNSLLNNITDFLYSLPTILGLVIIAAIVLRIVGATVKTIIKIALRFFIITILLGFFGISLPSPMQIFNFALNMGNKLLEIFR